MGVGAGGGGRGAGGAGGGGAGGRQLVELQTIRQSYPQPVPQHAPEESSAAVHSLLPRAAHSTAASSALTYSPLKLPVTGVLKPLALTSLEQIESKQAPPLGSQHWIDALAAASTHSKDGVESLQRPTRS